MKKLEVIKDSIGNPYLVIKYHKDEIEKEYNMFYEYLKNINIFEYNILTHNRMLRDGVNYHITVINAMEYKKMSIDIDDINLPITDIIFEGIGHASKYGNDAYFIVVTSNILNNIREKYGFEYKDFHITLGFNKKDVFGVSKGKDSIIL